MRANGKSPELEQLLQGLESFCYYDPESGDLSLPKLVRVATYNQVML